MRLNNHKTRVMTYSRKTNVLWYDYRLCRSAIARTSSIMDLGIFFDSKLYFHNHVDFLFCECIKILGLIRSITFRFSSFECLFLLYTALIRPRLEYASVVWNSITSTDSKKLECIQKKFAFVCFYRFFSNLPYNYVLASNVLNLPSLSMRRQHIHAPFFIQAYRGLKFCSSLSDIVSLRIALRNVRVFTLCSVCPSNKCCPSARCAYAASAVEKYLDTFADGPVSLDHILRACAWHCCRGNVLQVNNII
jgi:hypothetical protein